MPCIRAPRAQTLTTQNSNDTICNITNTEYSDLIVQGCSAGLERVSSCASSVFNISKVRTGNLAVVFKDFCPSVQQMLYFT